jgi:hypothetical protein
MRNAAHEDRSGVPPQAGVGPGWFIGIVLLLAVMAGVFAFSQFNAAVGQPPQPSAQSVGGTADGSAR